MCTLVRTSLQDCWIRCQDLPRLRLSLPSRTTCILGGFYETGPALPLPFHLSPKPKTEDFDGAIFAWPAR